MTPSIEVNVVVCTRNRAAFLARALADLERQKLSGIALKVIVVDNGSLDETAELLRLKRANLQLVSLSEAIPGKSRSLNLALTRLTGELALFTDDDVSFGPDWVSSYVRAAYQFPECALFCGPIIPEFPAEAPPWLQTHQWSGSFFGTFNKERPEGRLPEELLPFGANVAFRTEAIAGMQFRMDLGPSESNGRLMCEDVDFARRVRDKWHDCVYVPSAAIRHHVRAEQMMPSWLYDRAFVFGKSTMLFKKDVTIPSFSPNDSALDEDGGRIDQACLIHFYCGQLAACGMDNMPAIALLRQAMSSLDVHRYHAVLTPEAGAAFASSPMPEISGTAPRAWTSL